MNSSIFHLLQNGQSFLTSNDNNVFLGKLSLNRYDTDSVSNPYGNYGSKYSTTSIWNKYGTYGSPYSYNSAFNPYTMSPPRIYLRGIFYGFLSKNRYIGRHVTPDDLTHWMEINNLRY